VPRHRSQQAGTRSWRSAPVCSWRWQSRLRTEYAVELRLETAGLPARCNRGWEALELPSSCSKSLAKPARCLGPARGCVKNTGNSTSSTGPPRTASVPWLRWSRCRADALVRSSALTHGTARASPESITKKVTTPDHPCCASLPVNGGFVITCVFLPRQKTRSARRQPSAAQMPRQARPGCG